MFPKDGIPNPNDENVVKRQEYFLATKRLKGLYEELDRIRKAIVKEYKIIRENR